MLNTTNVSKSRIKQRGGAEPGTVLHFTVDGGGGSARGERGLLSRSVVGIVFH